VVSQGRLIVVVGIFLIGCAILLLAVGCAGTSSETSKKEQGSSPEATASEVARCEGTRKINVNMPVRYTTNDLPGCPSGGLLLGTDGPDKLFGGDGEDKIRGLGGKDSVYGGPGNDVIHAGPGNDDDRLSPSDRVGGFSEYGDDVIYGGDGADWITSGGGFGEDVIYGGDGSDKILTFYDHQPDKLYCGKGEDYYATDKHDYVDSSCEVPYGQNA
jgi:Ca2+-binding RTX toxin-like protein